MSNGTRNSLEKLHQFMLIALGFIMALFFYFKIILG